MNIEGSQNMYSEPSYGLDLQRGDLKRHRVYKDNSAQEPKGKADRKFFQKLQAQTAEVQNRQDFFTMNNGFSPNEYFPTLNFSTETFGFADNAPSLTQDTWIVTSELNKPKKKYNVPFQGRSKYGQGKKAEEEFVDGGLNANYGDQMVLE